MEDRPSDLAEGRRCLLCDEEFFVFMMERLRSVSSTVELLGKRKCDPITEETEKRLGRWGGRASRVSENLSNSPLRHCRVQVLAPSEPG